MTMIMIVLRPGMSSIAIRRAFLAEVMAHAKMWTEKRLSEDHQVT